MRLIGITAVAAALLSPGAGALAQPQQSGPKVGEEYEISRSYETSEQTSDGSSSSTSSGHNTILERVIGVREGGLELEYDLPRELTAEDRARIWQFPVRVFRPSSGPMQLLNRPELEARVERWLKAAGWPRTVCGRWIFTWNAFRIECDPQSAIEAIEAFDLRSADLREGATYSEAESRAPGTLRRKAAGTDGATFVVVLEVDPGAVHRARAEADVVVGEIMQKPVTLDAALRERAKEQVTGTITVTFETDSAGNVRRRTRLTKLETKLPDGQIKSSTVEETVERRLVSGPAAHR